MFIFFHIETYIKYLPHVEEISEAEFIGIKHVKAQHCSIFGRGRRSAAPVLRAGSASLKAGGQSAARLTIALICRNTKKKKKNAEK